MAKDEAVDPTQYLDKAATPLQARFGDWIKEEVGYNPAGAKTKEEAFREGVRIATATRMVFQASDFNRTANEEQRAANAKAREERAAKAKRTAEEAPAEAPSPKAAKTAPTKKAPAKRAPAATAEEAPAAPVKAARRAPRRAPAAAAASATEAPF